MRRFHRRLAGRLAACLLPACLLMAAPPAATAQNAELSAADRETVERVQRHIEGIDTLRAGFRQRSSNGTRATGRVWIDRPGKVRFDYDKPSDTVMIANGSWLLYFDRRQQQTSYVPVDETPLWPLLKPEVDILDAETFSVADVARADGRVRVTVARGDVRRGEPGSLELYFRDDPLALTRWRLVDQQGTVTVVDLTGVERGVEIDAAKFDFDALDLPEEPGGK